MSFLMLFLPRPQPGLGVAAGAGHQEPAREGAVGQVAARVDDGVGAGPPPQGQVGLPAGAREGQELRLGGVAQALPQVPQQQEVPRHRPHAQGKSRVKGFDVKHHHLPYS